MKALPPVSRPAPARAGPSAAPEPHSDPAPRPVALTHTPAEPQIGAQRNFRGPAASTAAQAYTGMGMCILVKYSWEQLNGP